MARNLLLTSKDGVNCQGTRAQRLGVTADFAIVVVDVQSDFAAGQKTILARIVELLLFARAEGIDVLHVHSNR